MDGLEMDNLEIDGSELADEVLHLALAWQQGSADADERGRLEYLLANSAKARMCYVAVVHDTVVLSDVAGAQCLGDGQDGMPASVAKAAGVGAPGPADTCFDGFQSCVDSQQGGWQGDRKSVV